MLELIHDGGDKLKIYRDGGRIFKHYFSASYKYVAETTRVHTFLREAGLPVPAVYGVRRVSRSETVLEMAYIDSKPFTWPGMPDGEWEKAMRAFIKLQCGIAAVDASGFPEFTKSLAKEIRGTPYLTRTTKARAIRLMRRLDKGKTNLCHGDMHPGNVLFDGETHWVIDWGSASRGDPAADACMTYLYERRFGAPGRADTYLRLLCEEARKSQAEVLAWLPVIAAYQVNIKTEDERAYILKIIEGWEGSLMARNILKVKRKPKVVKAYRQSVPAARFIGIKYGDEDRVNGGFGGQWGEWHENGRFEFLEQACLPAEFEDAGAHIGLMRWKGGKDGNEHEMAEPFQYWVGKFFAEGAEVPEGYDHVDFPALDLGVGWLYGRESYLYGKEGLAADSCGKQGMKIICDDEGAFWFFERYVCPRFTQPDKKGKKILDICHYIEKENKEIN